MHCDPERRRGGRAPLWLAAASLFLSVALAYQLKIDVRTEKPGTPGWLGGPRTDADKPENTPAVEEPELWNEERIGGHTAFGRRTFGNMGEL